MKTIVFNSPYQVEVDASEHHVLFRRGEPREVEDHVAELLLQHPHFSEVDVVKGALVIEPTPPEKQPEQIPTYAGFVNEAHVDEA